MPAPSLLRSRRVGLRTRATAAFTLTAVIVALFVSGTTYAVARRYLTDERESAARRQAYVNARLVRTLLRTTEADLATFLASLGGGSNSSAIVRYQDEWFASRVAVGSSSLPRRLVAEVLDGSAAEQRFRDQRGELHYVVGVPVTAVGADYYELFPLDDLERTLGLIVNSLVVGSCLAVVGAAILGRVSANRLVRPLHPVADAAEQISTGALDTRLDEAADPDLRRLFQAFNAMAAALEERVEREARFAADVSHELRSPLTAVAAALEIINRRRAQLPPEVIEAFTVLREKTDRFQQMVLDLLEISRMDAGTALVEFDVIETRDFLRRVIASHHVDDAAIDVAADVPATFQGDRRRLTQALGNLIENAANYAGGITAIYVTRTGETIRFAFDDKGPGVAPDERDAIFGRFARGKVGAQSGPSTGTGLGLALVAEHARLHRGSVWVEDAPAGGARFVFELPIGPNHA